MRPETIVIAVSGSIAAYKTCDLVRNLARKKIPVRVCMTRNATRFVGPVTFQTLSGQDVIVDEWDHGMLHIDLKNEAALWFQALGLYVARLYVLTCWSANDHKQAHKQVWSQGNRG